jgi:hypothetical protein
MTVESGRVFRENSLMQDKVPSLCSGFRLRAQTPARRLNFDSTPLLKLGVSLDFITTTAPVRVPSKLDFAKDQDSERKEPQ